MSEIDITAVARVHELAFSRQQDSEKWISCNFRASPRILIYVANQGTEIIGYIQWAQKSGFRPEVVIELEQIGVLPSHQNKGVGSTLINESLKMVKTELKSSNSIIKHIMVTTRADNYAQQLYRKMIGAEIECTLKDLYSADEVIMIARNIDKRDA